MIISRTIEIDMGHRVPNHKSKCRNLHGHRYKFEVGVDGDVIAEDGASDQGMVIDFGDLKQIMMEEIDAKFDHGFMMYEDDPFRQEFEKFRGQKIVFVPFIPTAENIAKFVFDLIKPLLKKSHMQLKYVKVWETPNSTAVYHG